MLGFWSEISPTPFAADIAIIMIAKIYLLLFVAVAVTASPLNQIPLTVTSERQPQAAIIHDSYWGGPVNTCNQSTLRVFKSPSSGGHDLSTMLTFQYPGATNCWLEFDAPAVQRGGRQVDVYTQWAVVDQCPSTANNRDRNLGRLEIPESGGKATWVAVYGDYLVGPGSRCPTEGKIEGIEIVGVGDDQDLRWSQGSGKGVRVLFS